MGLLGRLFGGPGRSRKDGVDLTTTVWVKREERIDVVGESHYQPAIRKACAWRGPDHDTRFECMAELVPEPTNRHDPNAIMVLINGGQVGYLSRADAKELGDAISEGILRQGTGMCRAVIAGRGGGRTDNLGVFLHLDVSRV